MADHRIYYKKGAEVKYFPDDKVLLLQPGKSNKDDFLRLKSSIDTILQVDGTKRVGNTFTLKLSDTFNVNVDEVLKSFGMKGGIEQEDAQSMIDDAAEEEVKDQTKEQQAQVQPQSEMPQLESILNKGVYSFLFEDEFFNPGTIKKKRKASKRFGKYWKPIEAFTGKNKNSVDPNDILDIRRKFSLKPYSKDRNVMLASLDKAANYFYQRLEKEKGLTAADDFREDYISIDDLKPEDYEVSEEDYLDQTQNDANINNDRMSLVPNYDDIDYNDLNIEED